jgi:diaminopimelate epimerase
MNRVLQLQWQPDGRVTVDMEAPDFELSRVPFDAAGLQPVASGLWQLWPLVLLNTAQKATVSVAIVSMGNPHAVMLVDDVDSAPVLEQGPLVQGLPAFPRSVNVGFMQVLDRSHVRLRVYERGAGETLACGTGACAAVVSGIRLGLLDATVDVSTHGGTLTISWQGGNSPVMLTGPATYVFHGDIELPNF